MTTIKTDSPEYQRAIQSSMAELEDPRDRVDREGMQAAKDGLEHWMNPYAGPCGGPNLFTQWYAGWCKGMQLKKQGGKPA